MLNQRSDNKLFYRFKWLIEIAIKKNTVEGFEFMTQEES
jgi:hypothetical protein